MMKWKIAMSTSYKKNSYFSRDVISQSLEGYRSLLLLCFQRLP
ncbi:hypothetical protein MtrunA17_Chr7g0246191 [Medicago truncatula]|uniref:Uncharacterized protein n=1 Tax=Medicago truncatula TaxID=3880 RepID=A0A396H219_MEDTR|nr:hypothetical protein MtrunA17_Chr7g0246191 [Medicago truncatula]